MLLQQHQRVEHARSLQQGVQPGVTTFRDVSCFQPVAEVRGSGCGMVPNGAEAARMEGRSAAVLREVLARAPGWLEKPCNRRSPGFEGDQQKCHYVILVLMQEGISVASPLVYSI